MIVFFIFFAPHKLTTEPYTARSCSSQLDFEILRQFGIKGCLNCINFVCSTYYHESTTCYPFLFFIAGILGGEYLSLNLVLNDRRKYSNTKKRKENYLVVLNRVNFYSLICSFFQKRYYLGWTIRKQIKGGSRGRGGCTGFFGDLFISFSFVFVPSLLEWSFPCLVY